MGIGSELGLQTVSIITMQSKLQLQHGENPSFWSELCVRIYYFVLRKAWCVVPRVFMIPEHTSHHGRGKRPVTAFRPRSTLHGVSPSLNN